jgi:hypothetical protein
MLNVLHHKRPFLDRRLGLDPSPLVLGLESGHRLEHVRALLEASVGARWAARAVLFPTLGEPVRMQSVCRDRQVSVGERRGGGTRAVHPGPLGYGSSSTC